MKKILLCNLLLPSLLSIGCGKKEVPQCPDTAGYSGPVQVVKDCTGTYIRHLEKDYRVCNEELLKYYANGSLATLTFSKVSACPDMPRYICNMYHHNEGSVTISCIR